MSSLPVDGLLFVARHGAGEPGLELPPLGLQVLAALPRLVHLLLQLPHLHQTKPSGQKMNAGHCCPGAESSAAEQSWSLTRDSTVPEITGKGTILCFSFIEGALGTHLFQQKKKNLFTFLYSFLIWCTYKRAKLFPQRLNVSAKQDNFLHILVGMCHSEPRNQIQSFFNARSSVLDPDLPLYHFAGSGSASKACRSRSGSVSISNNYTFSRKFPYMYPVLSKMLKTTKPMTLTRMIKQSRLACCEKD